MMWIMLAVLIGCLWAISVLSAAEFPNFNLILFFLVPADFFCWAPTP